MRLQLCVVTCVSIVSSACGAADGDETVAAVQSLQTLGEPKIAESAPAVRASIIGAGSRLCDLQADRYGDNSRNGLVDDDPDDGGWDWQVSPSTASHSSSPSPRNLYGATGLGLWTALQFGTSRLRLRTALMETYWGIEQNPEIASAPDVVLLSLLSDRYSDQRYADLARERYDKRVEVAGDANLLAAKVRDERHAAGTDGLIAYDLAWFALAALELGRRYPGSGYHADFTRYVTTVLDDLNASTPDFDYRDAHEAYYVTGLAWSMLVCSWRPRSRATFDDLVSRLLDQQLSSGAWPHNADYPEANLQATAHSLIALGLTGRGAPAPVTNAAVSWISSRQQENGGWSYAPDQEFPLLDAEATLGMYLVRSRTAELAANDLSRSAFSLSESRPSAPPAPAAPSGTP